MIGFLAVQNESLEKVSRSFRDYSEGSSLLAPLVGGLLFLGIAGLVLYALFSGRDRLVGRRVFLRLARVNALSPEETRLLMDVARRVQPDNPPAIFVRRSLFEGAMSDAVAPAALVLSLRRKVYGP